MGWKFNPFTGALDQTGSTPASYIDGEVATYNDLPLSSTTAPLDTAWLVRSSSGVWPFTNPGGVYIRTATGGSSRDADYTYAGVFPDVFSDANFTLYDDADTSKLAKFQLSGITTGTTRTLTVPNASGTIARTQDFAAPPAIGSTTPSAGSFSTLSASSTISATAGTGQPPTSLANAKGVQFSGINAAVYGTYNGFPAVGIGVGDGPMTEIASFQAASMTLNKPLVANNGTLTASAPVLDLSQTWNNAAPTYKTMVINVTNTGGSNSANNYPLEIQSGGTAVASIALDGRFRFSGTLATGSGTSWSTWLTGTYNNTTSINSPLVVLGSGGTGAGSAGVRLQTEGVEHILALRNGTNPQTFRLYSTYSSATSFERLNIAAQTGGSFIIGTEKGSGGGTARGLEFRTDNTARLTIGSGGGFTLADAQDIAVGTTTGTKIATGTTQRLGFWNATPAVQPAAVADATDAATVITQLNALLSRLRTIGIIAT